MGWDETFSQSARIIVEKGGDFLLQIKGSQPNLLPIRGQWGGVERRNPWRRDALRREDRSRKWKPQIREPAEGVAFSDPQIPIRDTTRPQ
jgi:hypothetical protein